MRSTFPSPGSSLQLQPVVIPCSAVIRGKKPMPPHNKESLFLHSWSQFLTDFDVTPLISKLRTSSTRWARFCNDRTPVKGSKWQKNAPNIAHISVFGHFRTPYGHHSGMITTYSCRGGSEFQFKECYIKIGQELASEMRKMWSNLNFDMITFKFDNLIHAVLTRHWPPRSKEASTRIHLSPHVSCL